MKSKVRSLLAIRVFDLWAHEQDMRRALNEPGGLERRCGGAQSRADADGCRQRAPGALAPPAGTALVFDITGPGGALRAITFDGERGRAGVAVPERSSATLRLDLPTLTVLTCGRSDDPGAARGLPSKVTRTWRAWCSRIWRSRRERGGCSPRALAVDADARGLRAAAGPVAKCPNPATVRPALRRRSPRRR